jgi:HemY protein
MKTAIGLVALLAVAVGSALVVGSNQASVTFFWSPYRMDVSLNLFLFGLAGVFLVLHLAWRALGGLFDLPREARRWRMRQQERAMHGALLMAQNQWMAGRFIPPTTCVHLLSGCRTSKDRWQARRSNWNPGRCSS